MRSYAGSDRGRRTNNEDVVWAEDHSGLYLVIDGMGGHRAGECAAQIACEVLRRRLSTPNLPDARTLKESIVEANNEIYNAAQADPEKFGMGCVLTVACIRNGHLLIGHVGDTRLYRIQRGVIEKLTRDHSPVGDMEAGGLLTEEEARRHPRRHQIYRDVGTKYRQADTPSFIDIYEETFPPDAALVLCSDGLTDVLSTDEIYQIVQRHAGHPQRSVRALIDSANEQGGKDNISLIVVEGDQFPSTTDPDGDATRRIPSSHAPRRRSGQGRLAAWLLLAATLVGLLIFYRASWSHLFSYFQRRPQALMVRPGGFSSIAVALAQAQAGDTVTVAPGIYRETVHLRSGVTLMGEGFVQLAPPEFPAVVADRVTQAAMRGFEIDGPEHPRPERPAILLTDADASIRYINVAGNTRVGVELRGGGQSVIRDTTVAGHEIGVLIYGDARPELQGNLIVRNSIGVLAAERSRPAIFLNLVLENQKREVIVDAEAVPTRFDTNMIGLAGADIRNPDLKNRLDPEHNNVYVALLQGIGAKGTQPKP